MRDPLVLCSVEHLSISSCNTTIIRIQITIFSKNLTFHLEGCDFCCGWMAGMAGLLVGHPIDTLKVRQQVLGRPMFESIVTIHGTGGTLTFFRGMGVPLLSTGAMNSVYFGFYGTALEYMLQWRNERNRRRYRDDKNQATSKRQDKHVESYWDYFVAGCVGGAGQLVIACPVDLVKVQLQSQIKKSVIKGPLDCVLRIVKAKGIFGLYKGLTVQAWRDIPSSGCYFVIYEFLKREFSFGQDESTKVGQFMAGGIAGILSWWTIIPLDVIKSRIQGETDAKNQKYKGIVHCGMIIVRSHGIKGLFHGFLPLSIRAFPVNGTTFLVYEWLFRHCNRYENKNTLYS